MTKQERVLITFGILIYSLLVIFSYAHVDLNLTLSQNTTALLFIKNMQALGYYNRPLSTIIFILLIIFLFSFFIVNLILASKKNLTIKYIFTITVLLTAILVFAYPFLSSDIFNYMFDAKIILKYHLNPYTHKALDFPADDWIRFMRWTHRYSPYGPVWLLISIVPSLLGFGKFILTILAFKILVGIFHFANTIIIYRILKKIKSNEVLLGVAFYALNPLFLIEGVVNGHNDVILATSLLLTVYFIVYKKVNLSTFIMAIGFLIKYLPVLTLPGLLLLAIKKISIEKFIILNFIMLLLFTIIVSTFPLTVPFISKGSTQVQFQPWYLFWAIPYISLLGNKKLMLISITLCFGANLRYLPFLYYGEWSQPGTIMFMKIITFIPTIILFPLIILNKFVRK